MQANPKDVTVLAERPTCHCCIHRTTQILPSLKTLIVRIDHHILARPLGFKNIKGQLARRIAPEQYDN